MKEISLKVILCLFFIITVSSCKKLEKEMMVLSGEITNIQYTSAAVSGTIVDIGEGAIQHGHCYSESADPKNGQKTSLGKPEGTTSFTSQLTNLKPGTTYYITAYVSGGTGTSYGAVKNFTTLALTVPVLNTSDITDITTTTSKSGGEITSEGGSPVTSRGVCWSTQVNPTTGNAKTTDGSGTGGFTSNMTGLTPGTKYYVRAYAINSTGTGYGAEKTFTSTAALPATLSPTTAATAITLTKATTGGNITADGGMPVTDRGVCWNTTGLPTIAGSKISNGTGTGAFTSNLTGLTPGTKYYVRAYATNYAGTAYGDEISFTTTSLATPVLTGPASATTTFNISWTFAWPTEISADDHYELEWSYSSTSGFQLMGSAYQNGVRTSPFTEYIMPEAVDIGKTVYLRVRAKSAGFFSPYSNVVGVSVATIDLSFNPTADNLVMQSSVDASYETTVYNTSSLGAGNAYFISTFGNDSFVSASTLYFNIDNIISGGTIQKAILRLYVQSLPDDTDADYAVNALTESWNTNTITFDNLPTYYVTPEALKPIPSSMTAPLEIDVTSIVQAWANGSVLNYGFIIRESSFIWPAVTKSRVADFYSVESAPAGKKPELYIEIR